MKFIRIPTLVLLISSLGFGCSHGLRGKPVDERTSFESGVSLSSTPVGGCIVRAGVKEIQPKRLAMLIEVINQTQDVIPLRPTQFLVKGTALKNADVLFPIDPERTIASAAAAIEILEEKLHPSLFSVVGSVSDQSVLDVTLAGNEGLPPPDDKSRLEHFRVERARWERESLRDGELLEMSRSKGFLLFNGEFGSGSFHLVSQSEKCPADLLFEVD